MMRLVKSFLVGCCFVTFGCTSQQPEKSRGERKADVAIAADVERNNAFWKGVAKVHFTEDRSHRGERLPTARLFDENGRPTTLVSQQGKPLFVNFWARWCVPCRAEMPTIEAMAAKRSGTIKVVAVNEDVVQPTREKFGELNMAPMIFRVVDRDGALARSIANGGLPTTVLYGSDGREKWRLVGVLDWTKPQAQKLLRDAV